VRKQQHDRFLANPRSSAFNGCKIVCGQYCDWQNYRSRIENFHFPTPRELGCQASSLTLVQLTHSTLKLVINPDASGHGRVERPSSRTLDSDCRVVYFFFLLRRTKQTQGAIEPRKLCGETRRPLPVSLLLLSKTKHLPYRCIPWHLAHAVFPQTLVLQDEQDGCSLVKSMYMTTPGITV
jgi:hypothetical protein